MLDVLNPEIYNIMTIKPRKCGHNSELQRCIMASHNIDLLSNNPNPPLYHMMSATKLAEKDQAHPHEVPLDLMDAQSIRSIIHFQEVILAQEGTRSTFLYEQ